MPIAACLAHDEYSGREIGAARLRVTDSAYHHSLPTPCSALRNSSVCVSVWRKACRRQAAADPQRLVDTGRGKAPLIQSKFRRSNSGSRLADFVCRSR